ncbi:MAG: hypothetical protein LAQ30_19785, partial [Acidobacteriia bacterium]|nr:hypothetical protein [Terriglobia bacterium]
MNYHDFFLAATGGREPFRFQERFREEHGNLVVLSAPTGLGKTDTALISFLHRLATRPGNPKRLAWCLHGRALTEQIADVAEGHIGRLVAAGMLQAVPVYRLLGGSADNDL